MKTSSPETPKPKSPLAILLIGPPGGGKSTLALQFPNVWFADCDDNLDGPERFLRKTDPKLSYSYDRIRFDDDNQPVPTAACYDRLMDKLSLVAKEPTVKTVVVDSLTAVNEFIIRSILRKQARGEMEARDWIPFKSHMLDLLWSKLRNTGKTTICLVHETKVEEVDKKNIMVKTVTGFEPSVQGSITDYFGAFYTDMWRCTAEPAPGDKVEYHITTNRTAKSDLKNSLGMDNEIVVKQGERAYDKIKKWLEV